MDNKDWLLMLVATPEGKGDEITKIDPIRIMKGMFYFIKNSLRSDIYEFEPYLLGPVSFAIYHDLDELIEEGYVAAEDVPGETWKRYYATPSGLSRSRDLEKGADSSLVKSLREHKQRVCSLGFFELLKTVYKDYPEFATQSIFKF